MSGGHDSGEWSPTPAVEWLEEMSNYSRPTRATVPAMIQLKLDDDFENYGPNHEECYICHPEILEAEYTYEEHRYLTHVGI